MQEECSHEFIPANDWVDSCPSGQARPRDFIGFICPFCETWVKTLNEKKVVHVNSHGRKKLSL